MKILNLYAGIGGNRKLWKGHEVTSVEYDETIADIYIDHFPNDKVVVDDAHKYLKNNFQDYEFIWASPPCPTHSKMRKNFSIPQGSEPKYPDAKLWQEILFLQGYFEGDWVVENVKSWYKPFIKNNLQETSRHYFWSNFVVPDVKVGADNIRRQDTTVEELEERYGFDTSGYGLRTRERRKLLNNCVNPKVGKAILDAKNKKQASVVSFGETDK